MIVKMSKIKIYGPKDLLESVTNTLFQMGVLHVEQMPPSIAARAAVKERLTEDKEAIREKVELETLVDKLKKALVLLPRPEGTEEEMNTRFLTGEKDSDEVYSIVDELYRKIEEVFAREKEANDQIDLLKKYEKMIKTLVPLVAATPETHHLEMVGVTIDKRNEDFLEVLERELTSMTGGNFHIFKSDIDKETTAAVLAFGKSFAPRIKEMLWESNLNEIKLPSDLEDIPLKEALQNITIQGEKLPEERRMIQEEIRHLSRQWYYALRDLKESVEGKLQQLAASHSFLRTKYSFVVGGFIPNRSLGDLESRLEKEYAGKVILEKENVPHDEKDSIPVHMVNNRLIKPFEVFVNLLPAPVYGTVDPTIFLAIFFPLFFGLILGDAGYGVVALIFCLFMRKKLKKGSTMHDIFTVLAYSSVFSIIFGLIYAEVFGTLGEHFLHMHPMIIFGVELNRLTNITFFLGFSVFLGVIHVFLGIILGMVNAVRTGHRKHLFFKIGQFASLLSLLMLVVILAGYLPKELTLPISLVLIVGLIAITIFEGFVAPIELLSAVGNILSYARIMAIGLASVILALVANELGAMPKSIIVGVIIASLLHLVNIVLGLFSPTIHAMRLHLVEFFGKFYETGGKEYKPFKKHGGD